MLRRLVLAGLVFATSFGLSACAGQECDFHSQCGARYYCERGRCLQNCRQDFDCDPGLVCNAIGQCVVPSDGGPRLDSGPPPGVDSGPPRLDSGPPPRLDSGPPPRVDGGPPGVDSGPPPGVGRYLDRCTRDGDCGTGLRCVDDVGGTRACTIACSTHRDCASEHVCVDGTCRHDDTGTGCSLTSPASCALGLCIGNSTTGIGHCTRQCDNAFDCPSGYACADAGGTRVCVDIERPCASATDCATGLCFPGIGCTAGCRSASDCPRRFPDSPPYTCGIPTGGTQPVCLPPDDVIGPDPIGASCRYDGLYSLCRSGGCDDAAPTGPMCTQSCTQEGGCGPGLGCFPTVVGGTIWLVCSRAGNRAIGQPCSSGRECDSGLCDATGAFCTRLCTDDGLCPTGMRCDPIPGFGVSLCRR